MLTNSLFLGLKQQPLGTAVFRPHPQLSHRTPAGKTGARLKEDDSLDEVGALRLGLLVFWG